MEYLYQIDLALFNFFNSSIANPIFDFMMPILTNESYWLPIYIIGILYLIIKGGKIGRITALALIITVIISDQLSSSILKEFFGRIRPCHTLDNVRLLVGCGGGKSFPSSHAVNNFAAAMVLFRFYPNKKAIFFSIAAIVAFTRVYCGVHYPFDIIGGTIIGLIIGYFTGLLTLRLWEFVENKFFSKKNQ